MVYSAILDNSAMVDGALDDSAIDNSAMVDGAMVDGEHLLSDVKQEWHAPTRRHKVPAKLDLGLNRETRILLLFDC